jgi:hypothetical protein
LKIHQHVVLRLIVASSFIAARLADHLVLWKAQVMPTIRGAQLEGHLNGDNTAPAKEIDIKIAEKTVKSPNPDYAT